MLLVERKECIFPEPLNNQHQATDNEQQQDQREQGASGSGSGGVRDVRAFPVPREGQGLDGASRVLGVQATELGLHQGGACVRV